MMSIPSDKKFYEILNSMSLTSNSSDNYESILIKEMNPAKDKDIQYIEPEIKLWYSSNTEIKFESLINKIESELLNKLHKSNKNIVYSILGILAFIKSENVDLITLLNSLIENIYKIKAVQHFILRKPLFPITENLELNSFTLSLIDHNKIKYLCDKSCSNFYIKYIDNIKGKFSIERFNIIDYVINFSTINNFDYYNSKKSFRNLILNYFEQVCEEMFKDFWNNFLEEQHLLISLGGLYMDQRIIELFTESRLTIFKDIKYKDKVSGYVVPSETFLMIDLGRIDIRNYKIIRDLKENYNFVNYQNSEIHQAIKNVSLFLSKAKRFNYDKLFDESFLHFMIALELLLGDKNSSNLSVSERAAVLTHKIHRKSFEEQKKIISNLYDIRSKYVHKGIPVKKGSLLLIDKICEEILYVLLRLNKNENNHQKGFIESWLKKIDYVSKSILANEYISDDYYNKIGVIV